MKSDLDVGPPSQIFQAAREILTRELTRLPDLSAVNIVLPNLAAASGIAASFVRMAKHKTLLLPRFTTLAGWAEAIDIGVTIIPTGQRQALLYRSLREKNWFEGYDLWQITDELLGLVDELSYWQADFPENDTLFVEILQRATLKKLPAALRFEARLVYELWDVLNNTASAEITPAMAYVLRLQRLAADLDEPVYGVGLRDLIPAEEIFFKTLEEKGLAKRFPVNASADSIFHAAWPPPETLNNLRARAETYAQEFPAAGLSERLSLYGSYSLESEARAIEMQVREWLAEGKTNVALIAQDRLVARRVRALLERAQVLIEDETGWTLSTTSASAVVMRLLDTLEHNFAYMDFLDLVKSPFLFASQLLPGKHAAVAELEKLIRKYNVSAGFNNFFQVAKAHGSAQTVHFLQEFWQASREFNLQPKTLSLWLTSLLNTLSRLDALDALRTDDAGEQLIETLLRLRHNLQADLAIFDVGEWRAWLNRQLESATFRDMSIKSPVVFTHLSLTRAREFDAVIIMGADSRHLPGNAEAQGIFDEGIRLELGLPTAARQRAIEKQDLIDLLNLTPHSLITWQRYREDEPNLLSPYFEQLSVFHELAFNKSLEDAELAWRLAQYSQIPLQRDLATLPPTAQLPPTLVPQSISAVGFNYLMQCPYQFYARFGLGLAELDEIKQDMEKKDYGLYVHDILNRFHTEFPQVSCKPREDMNAALRAISEKIFAPAVALNFNARAWALRWLALIPSYIDWQYAREAEGWQWHGGEVAKELKLSTGVGDVTLRGRIDRVDRRGEEYAVLDYKTQDKDKLNKLLKPAAEEMPLIVYSLLWDQPVVEAAYICVDENTQFLPYREDLRGHAERSKQLLSELFYAMHSGATLPAHGIDTVCSYCEMEGLCRKGFWRG